MPAKSAAKKQKVSKKVSGGKKSVGKKNFSSYIHKVLKQASKAKLTMSSKTMNIVNSFIFDHFEKIAVEAAALTRVNKKQTLGSREIQTAVRLVLPADLAKHAMAEGTKAVAKLSA